MGKSKSTKNASKTVKVMDWDELIGLAEENARRNALRLGQLQALIRFFKGRKAAGEPCPVEAANVEV